MQHYRQFRPLIITDFEVNKWQHPEHDHNHYELIFIKKGEGRHVVNQIGVPYCNGDVFLLGPDDKHYFEVGHPTRFIYIKFTDIYLYQENDLTNSSIRHLAYLIKSRETHLSGFPLKAHDRYVIEKLFDVIIALHQSEFKNDQLVWLQVLAIATILQQNMPELKAVSGRTKDLQALFCYLHKNIHTPEHLKAITLAKHFNTTTGYIGVYFKRSTGTTLRQYIGDYRKGLILQRLKSGNYSLKQIAFDFGLTDESHVHKIISKTDKQ